MFWIFVGIGVLAYIIADAFFEITAKLSGWWKLRARPVLRRVWGAVVGRLPARAAPAAAPPITAETPPTSSTPNKREAPPISAGAVLAFLWKAKGLILIGFIALWAWNVLGCTPPWAKSRDTLRAELKEARITEAVTAHEASVATKAIVLAERTHNDRRRREAVIAQTEQELTDAVEASDFDRLHSAYERGTYGVWDDLQPADRPDPAPPGTAPVRRPGADAA